MDVPFHFANAELWAALNVQLVPREPPEGAIIPGPVPPQQVRFYRIEIYADNWGDEGMMNRVEQLEQIWIRLAQLIQLTEAPDWHPFRVNVRMSLQGLNIISSMRAMGIPAMFAENAPARFAEVVMNMFQSNAEMVIEDLVVTVDVRGELVGGAGGYHGLEVLASEEETSYLAGYKRRLVQDEDDQALYSVYGADIDEKELSNTLRSKFKTLYGVLRTDNKEGKLCGWTALHIGQMMLTLEKRAAVEFRKHFGNPNRKKADKVKMASIELRTKVVNAEDLEDYGEDVPFHWEKHGKAFLLLNPTLRLVCFQWNQVFRGRNDFRILEGAEWRNQLPVGKQRRDWDLQDSNTIHLLYFNVPSKHWECIYNPNLLLKRCFNKMQERKACLSCFDLCYTSNAKINLTTHISRHLCPQLLSCKHCYMVFPDEPSHTAHNLSHNVNLACNVCHYNRFPNAVCHLAHQTLCEGKVIFCDKCKHSYKASKGHVDCSFKICRNCSNREEGAHICPLKILEIKRPFVHPSLRSAEDYTPPPPITAPTSNLIDDMAEEVEDVDTFGSTKAIQGKGGMRRRRGWNKIPKDNDVIPNDFYAFDFESEMIATPKGKLHRVVLGIVRKLFTDEELIFEPEPNEDPMDVYGSVIRQFCEWMNGLDNVVLIAHNMKSYDGRLIYDYMVYEKRQPPSGIVRNGLKFLTMGFKEWRVCIRDSHLHIATALDKLPEIFDMDPTQFKKGFFPYLFATPENRHYVGPLPDISLFEHNKMGVAKRKEFLVWYEREKVACGEHGYDYWHEMVEYCKSDVKILTKAMEIYIKEGADLNSGLNPMNTTTIASYAMQVYRSVHMPKNSIYILPQGMADFARAALRGGRTDVRQMYVHYTPDQLAQGHGLRYMDVQSLYPSVMMSKPMPAKYLGTWLEEEDPDLTCEVFGSMNYGNWCGFIEVDLMPPSKPLFTPVICTVPKNANPHASDGKLVATLLPLRKITITSQEYQLAIRNGYTCSRVYRVDFYRGREDLFSSYIRTFLKIKIQCSGMPSFITSDETWDAFAKEHKDRLGIELERDKMVKNPGKKQIAKLLLNSLWGKFGQRDMKMTLACMENSEYADLLAREEVEEIEIKWAEPMKDGMVLTEYKTFEANESLRLSTNVAIAAHVSAWGRVVLTEEMLKLKERVVYHDTDSVVFKWDPTPGVYNTPEGRYLGEWECETGGQPIEEFVSIGPKTYAYRYHTKYQPLSLTTRLELDEASIPYSQHPTDPTKFSYQKTVCKAKGFTLNYENGQRIEMESMKTMVFSKREGLLNRDIQPLYTTNRRFKYNLKVGGQYTIYENRNLSFTYAKGVVSKDLVVWPYGITRYANTGLEFLDNDIILAEDEEPDEYERSLCVR